MSEISLFLAFAAGLISFLSPCVLPLVPGYVGYMTADSIQRHYTNNKNNQVLFKSIAFVFGFSLIFIIMGASITVLGRVLIQNQVIFKKAAGIFMIIFGIHTSGIYTFKFLYKEKHFIKFGKAGSLIGSFIIGIAFAAGWTPCVCPILASILFYAGSMDTIARGILLLSCYSLGLGLPFVATAVAIDKLSLKLKKFTRYLRIISVVSGLFMIILGILIFTNNLGRLSGYFNFFTI